MGAEARVIIAAAVEGLVDEAVARKLTTRAGGQPGTIYGKKGKGHLRQKIHAYNKAARHARWIVLVDLDHDEDCAPPLRAAWIPKPAAHLCFRIAVREIEAWLMADAAALSEYLSVAPSRIPVLPEALEHPKAEMVKLARRSRRRAIREDMVPREGSGRPIGPAYTSRLVEYAESFWHPEIAARRAESLSRAIACLKRLIEESS